MAGMTERAHDSLQSLGLLVLRVGFGLMMAIGHGWGKYKGFDTILEKGWPDPFHVGASASLWMGIAAEVGCAVLIAVGLFTRLAAIPLAVMMGYAAFVIHAAGPTFLGGGDGPKEPALLYGLVFLTLIFTGPGKFSLDGLLFGRRPKITQDRT